MEQPKIKKGLTFTGWATFNWGINYKSVYRTRKEAIAEVMKGLDEGATWKKDGSKMFRVQKVKCIIL